MTPTLFVCANRRVGAGSCAGGGSHVLAAALRDAVAARGLDWEVRLSPCLGHCADGPNVKAAPAGPMLHQCRDAAAVLERLSQAWPPAAAIAPIR